MSTECDRPDPLTKAMDSIEVDEIVVRKVTVTDTKNWFKYRYVMQFLVFYAMFLVYAMRVNLSITIISMVNRSAIAPVNINNVSDECKLFNSSKIHQEDGPYVWNEAIQGYILNAFFVGYIITQIPGGYMADMFSVKWVFGYGIFLTSVLTLLSEAAVHIHVIAFIALRVLEGVCEGVTYPSLYALCARWSPVAERSWMAGIANLGTIIGTVVAIPVSALLSNSSWKWASVFYVFGSLGVIWSLLWYLLATSTPEKCRWMSDEEKSYIINTRGVLSFDSQSRRKIPWMSLLTSRAVWIISFCKLTNSFIFYIFLTEIPNYLHYIFLYPIEKNSWINSAAYTSDAIVALISSWTADLLISRNPSRITTVRKWYECSAQFLGALTIFLIPFCHCNYKLVVALLILNSAVNGLTAGGNIAVPIDIGPAQAGAIQGFANTVANIAGIIGPLLVGSLTKVGKQKSNFHFIETPIRLLSRKISVFSELTNDSIS